ncbi:hypothetical protein [Streptomyces sp. NPDC002566]|uniref:hypothetical protein n=1 Tax=Streptomyces sp. NPDC002566 TaxID=3364650 RepID=UPI003693535B
MAATSTPVSGNPKTTPAPHALVSGTLPIAPSEHPDSAVPQTARAWPPNSPVPYAVFAPPPSK